MEQKICDHCGKLLNIDEFYTFKETGRKDGVCSDCRTKGRDIHNLKDWLPLMKYYDIPCYIEEWHSTVDWLLIKNRPVKSIFGTYLNKMKLKGFINFGFEDSLQLNDENFLCNQRMGRNTVQYLICPYAKKEGEQNED